MDAITIYTNRYFLRKAKAYIKSLNQNKPTSS